MKKLLYIAFKDFSNLHFGANAKVLSQCRAFAQYGYEVDLIGRNRESTVLIKNEEQNTIGDCRATISKNKRLNSLLGKWHQYIDICRFLRGKEYDACYIRYDFSDRGFINLLKTIKAISKTIIIELPTYPYEAENAYEILSKIKLAIDKHYRKELHKYVDSFVTFYDGYTELFGVPVIVVPNGFDFTTMQKVTQPLLEKEIHIIAVSSMREWHGYERFIEGMRVYYQDGGEENIVLHLVGNGREGEKYKALTNAYGLNERVIFEGPMHGSALDDLYERCAIGIDSLARHRSGIDVLSSLKSREYGAKGIPMINSCKIDIIDEDFRYLLRVPADESPIQMEEVIAFFYSCLRANKTRQEVASEIRDYIESRSGMKQTLQAVVERMNVMMR